MGTVLFTKGDSELIQKRGKDLMPARSVAQGDWFLCPLLSKKHSKKS